MEPLTEEQSMNVKSNNLDNNCKLIVLDRGSKLIGFPGILMSMEFMIQANKRKIFLNQNMQVF